MHRASYQIIGCALRRFGRTGILTRYSVLWPHLQTNSVQVVGSGVKLFATPGRLTEKFEMARSRRGLGHGVLLGLRVPTERYLVQPVAASCPRRVELAVGVLQTDGMI